LITASALLVHLSGGVIEMHFHFFVMVALITLYEDWLPFLFAIGYVVLQHGVIGALDPTAVYDHPDAWANPWKWAAIHGVFVLAASAASVVCWRVVENARRETDLARQHLVTILESVTDAFFAVDAQGHIAYLNKPAARAVGRSAGAILGRPAAAAFDGTLGEAVYAQAKRQLDQHGEQSVELEIPYAPDRLIEVHASKGPDSGLAVSFRDVTARREAERQRTALIRAQAASAAAEANRARFAFLAEASRELSASLDDRAIAERLAALCVPVLADACTVDLDSESGEPVHASGGDPATNVTYHLDVPLEAGARCQGQLHLIRFEAERVFSEAEVALAEDLAGRAALALENARLYRSAREAVQDRDAFLVVAAHELKTPVASLHGYSQLLRRSTSAGQLPPVYRLDKALDVLERESAKLGRLITNLLDLARIEAGRLSLDIGRADLVALAANVVERARLIGPHANIELEAPRQVVLNCDALRLEQVITNLVDNAVKYSPADASIRVTIAELDSGQVTLTVRDTGAGISADKRDHIFDRFYRAHADEHASGMGLGLWISRQIVELHDGSIRAEFPPDGGTRMIVALPARQ
jgi:PAS domain S-box-containing protein